MKMKKMKKLLAWVLGGTLAVSSVVTTPVQAEKNVSGEAWWNGLETAKSGGVSLREGDNVEFVFTCNEEIGGDGGIVVIEGYDSESNAYLDFTSYGECWGSGAVDGSMSTTLTPSDYTLIKADNTYTASVSRENGVVTTVFKNVTTDTVLSTQTGTLKDTFSDSAVIYLYAQFGNYDVYVTDYPMTSLTIDESMSLLEGASKSLTVSAFEPEIADIATVSFASSDTDVATVDAQGMVTGVAEGTATITATSGTATAECTVTVTADLIAVTDITLTSATTVAAGTDLPLSATVAPADASNTTIEWSVKDAGTTGATVEGSTLKTTAAGTAVITATIADGVEKGTPFTKDFTITVDAPFIAVADITGIPTTVEAGTDLTLTGTVEPADANNQTIVWSVKDAGTTGAAIEGNILKTTASGIATITATIENGAAAGTAFTKDFTITVTSADENELVCGNFWTAFSKGFEITAEKTTYTFDAVSLGTNNWNTPIYVVYNNDKAEVDTANPHAESYKEYIVTRSDAYCWNAAGNSGEGTLGEGYAFETANAPADDAAWAAWLEANKAGVSCEITTQLVGSNAVVTFTNNGVTSTATIPVDTSKTTYISLTGEQCTLKDLKVNGVATSFGAFVNTYLPDTTTDNTNTTSNTTVAADATELVCTTFWSAFSKGFEVTAEKTTYTFDSVSNGSNNWNTPIYVVYNNDKAEVDTADPHGAAYKEYIVTRSDLWAWTANGTSGDNALGAGYSFETANAPADDAAWAAWLAANKAGVSCEITTQLVGTNAVVTFTNNGITSTATIPVDTSKTTYISLTGEQCTLKNLKINGTEASFGATSNPAAGAAAASTTSGSWETLKGTEWWTGMAKGADHSMKGDGTWTWTVVASQLVDGYGAFSVEIYDPATGGYITTGSDKNAWTAEGFNADNATVKGKAAEFASELVEGHTYAVTLTRSGNTFTFKYVDHTDSKEICTLTVTPAETVGNEVQTHVMAQVGTFKVSFNEGTTVATLGDEVPVVLFIFAIVGCGAIVYASKKKFAR